MMRMGVLPGRAHAENRRDACNGALHFLRGPLSIGAVPRQVRLPINSEHYTRLSRQENALVVPDRGAIPTDRFVVQGGRKSAS
jgi:hypothetical protein